MIRLVYSNRTEELARALARDVRAWHERRGPLEPFTLVVPNANVEAYVKLAIARAHGIAANLDVHLLRRFLAKAATRASRSVRLVDAATVLGFLVARLSDEASLARPELAPVRRYLFAAGDAAEAVDLRRVGLATEVARLFEEYGYSRPEMLRAWATGPALADTPFASAEAWQRRLWIDLFGGVSGDGRAPGLVATRAAAVGERWLSLPELFAEVTPTALEVPEDVHLFGISYVATSFHTLFARLATACTVHIYTLNPCREFWEDIATGPRLVDLDAPSDPPALRLWGRPGRENIRLLNELTECSFREAFVEPLAAGRSLLRQLQHDILIRHEERREVDPRVDFSGDESVRILACRSIRREAEAVAAEIWELIAQADATGAPLRLNEIAVVVPSRELEAYVTHLDAAFLESHALPHHVMDLPMVRASRIAEAVDLLLALPKGTFTRHEVMAVLTHPAVLARFPDVSASDWASLPDALGAMHGADHGDHAGTYITRDILNWDQAVKRLVLGAFMTGEKSGDLRPFEAHGNAYLPAETLGALSETAPLFGALVRSLIADARFARASRRTMPEWAAFLRALVSSYVTATNDAEERDLSQCLQALASLAAVDVDGTEVSFTIAAETARAALGQLTGARGQYLADGVAIASFLPMRAIPFRAIFVVGLGEGSFPAGDPKNPLDLRLATRRAGDVSPREQDKYMFLETLLSARERLYLSYVARDPVSGEELSPSSVVSDLVTMIERGYIAGNAAAKITREDSLRRYSKLEFPRVHGPPAPTPPSARDRFGAAPEARREAQIAALRADLERHLGGPAPELGALRAGLAPDVRRALDARLGIHELADAEAEAPATAATKPSEPAMFRLSLRALQSFLECPLQGYAAHRLGLDRDEDDDPLATEDEPFETATRNRTTLLREVLLESAREHTPADTVYAAHRTRRELEGRAPSGLFADAERPRHLAIVEQWLALLAEAGGGAPAPLRFGRAEEHARVDAIFDPVVLDVPTRVGGAPARVEVYGSTQPVSETPHGSWVFVAGDPPEGDKRAVSVRKRAIAAFLDHMLLAASGHMAERERTANVCFATESTARRETLTFPALTTADARAYLAAIAAELVSEHHAYLLPCEGALDFELGGRASSIEAIVGRLRDAYDPAQKRGGYSSVYGPIANPEDYPIPNTDDAVRMIGQRLRLLVDAVLADAP